MTEMQQLINDLSNAVNDLKTQLEAANDKSNGFRDQLLDTRHELIQKDYTVQNQTKALENLRITLERYEAENRALRDLVRVWV